MSLVEEFVKYTPNSVVHKSAEDEPKPEDELFAELKRYIEEHPDGE